MATSLQEQPKGFHLSLDCWAVLTALALALIVKSGLTHKVPW
jgi:hypothetical protein